MPASDCNSTGHINQSNLGYMVGVTGSYSKKMVSIPLGHQVALAVVAMSFASSANQKRIGLVWAAFTDESRTG